MEGTWPKITSKSNLQRRELKGDLLFTLDDYLTKQESEAFIRAADALGFVHQGSLGPSKGEAFRDNDRISLESPELAGKLWNAGLASLFKDIKVNGKVATGLNSNIRIYRYKQGQRFGKHIDESVEIDDNQMTFYTLLIYLNSASVLRSSTPKSKKGASGGGGDQLVGGETVFYSGRKKTIEVIPSTGLALLHAHGDDCLLHEAKPVLQGAKYVLRSDVVFATL